MRIRPLIAASLAAATLIATPAFAESVRVEYKDLDLATDAGQKTLQGRLDAAARQVCGMDDIRTGTRVPDASARKCHKDALASLEQQFAAVIDKARAGG